MPSLHRPPVAPQSVFAQHPEAVVQMPMHSDCPVGHVQVPVRQVCPPEQSEAEQQLDPGMHDAWQLLVPGGHWQVLLKSQASPPPQLALAQQGRPSVPHIPADPSDASVAASTAIASLLESPLATSCSVPVSAATWSLVAASDAVDASSQSGAQPRSWIESRPVMEAQPAARTSGHTSRAMRKLPITE